MPNWCENKLEIICDSRQVERLKPKLFSQTEDSEWYLDFNLLIPMPHELNIDSSSRGIQAKNFLELPLKKRLTYPLIQQYIVKSEVERISQKAKYHH
ncbi:hypothetical protein [Pasteurella oralis]|uniref:hypothetical protein n=1 Tax=Pasteurella oralis TaxID=1071947 RepID=UPI000C7B7C75|nr:hypothetical protein [Pasteurella oralis]